MMTEQARVQQSTVDDFMRIAGQLISEIAAYSGADVHDEAIVANLRQLRVMSSALNAALMTTAMMPPPLAVIQQVQPPSGTITHSHQAP